MSMKTRLGLLSGLLLSGNLLAAASIPLPPPDSLPARNVQQENRNLQLVYAFYQKVFNDHDLSAGAKYLAPSYIQHNPHVGDGAAPFLSYFGDYFQHNPQAHSTISQYGTFGDRVFLRVHSQQNPADPGRAIVDIFRVADGKIVEHWDSVQAVPDTAANDNTMF